MPNFFKIEEKSIRSTGIIQIYPAFQVINNSGLMIKGKQFYAVWDEESKLWSTNEFTLIKLVDSDIDKYISEHHFPESAIVKPMYLSNFSSNTWKDYKHYIGLMPDNFRPLDQQVAFNDYVSKRTDYISHKLNYCREEGPAEAYNKLMDKLYAPEEKEKLEWAIGSIFVGDSKKIQKFIVLRGDAGTGKSTVLNIIDKLFDGYTAAFEAKDLVSGDNQFAGDAFANSPLVGINEDANLSNVKDNSILNTIVGHGKMIINEKYKSKYELKPGTFLFIATNLNVKITDARSGLIRRIIDVSPTGNTHAESTYDRLMNRIFINELGQIANQCINTYERLGKSYYNNYRPLSMLYSTNPIFNFVEEHYLDYKHDNGVKLDDAYNDYKRFCDENFIKYPFKKYEFRDELGAYFEQFHDRLRSNDKGSKRSYFEGFKSERFESNAYSQNHDEFDWLSMTKQKSLLDTILSEQPAQYQDDHKPKPIYKWSKCPSKLSDLDTSKIHFVKVPLSHIVIDFDIKGTDGTKSEKMNKDAARHWPETYAELSKSGKGIHLHYIYDGNPEELSRLYDTDIEIKVFVGDASLRRKVTKCNNLPIAHLSVGDLPLKEKKVLKTEGFESLDKTRNVIIKALKKGNTGSTATEVSLIKKVLDDAYESGVAYDFRQFKSDIIKFAANSTNQSDNCLKMVSQMHFCSADLDEHDFVKSNNEEYDSRPIAFYDVEVLPNLFIICWKILGSDYVNRMINPSYRDVKELFMTNKYRWVGYNNRDYDNHMVVSWAYGIKTGITTYGLHKLSQRLIVEHDDSVKLPEAYGISYTDILDYTKEKKKLKKWEIDLGIHHQELGLPWDQEVPEELWEKVADYCANDVIATEAVWNATQGDFAARKILAEIAGGTPNDKTNKLSGMFIFEGNKNPQKEFNYRFMGEPEEGHTYTLEDDGITCFQDDGKPIFLGYTYSFGTSSYLDVDKVGEGGYVFAEVGNNARDPKEAGGLYHNVWTFDVASQHPSSIIAENLFGDYYTKRFKEILDLRLAVKAGDFEKARTMFNGKLAKYLDNPEMADALCDALKIVINSVYGLTSAKFDNLFRDKRNIDNIVAKRGALFMINLRNLVQKMGYTVVHCKTDSIKVENPDKKIYDFIMDYGKRFGYTFEIEHKFEKICLVNNAVYIAKLAKDDPKWIKSCEKSAKEGKPEPTRWTATGTQFQVPYVYKTLFTHEEIGIDDLAETKTVQKGDIYLDFNENLPDVSDYENCLETKRKIESGGKVTIKATDHLADVERELGIDGIKNKIASGHNYVFIGKVGRFCPIKPGYGGAIMYRIDDEKYFAPSGTSGYRWMETEEVIEKGFENRIDESYYKALVDDAIDTICDYGDFNEFVK